MGEEAGQPNEAIEPLEDVEGYLQKIENTFEEAMVNPISKKANPQSEARGAVRRTTGS